MQRVQRKLGESDTRGALPLPVGERVGVRGLVTLDRL
jgi:hypothetical protein